MSRTRYQTHNIKVPAGSNSIQEFDLETDNFYTKLEGIAVVPVSGVNDFSAVPQVALGFQSDKGVLQDRTHIKDYLTDVSVPFKERYKPFRADAEGARIKLSVEPLAGALGVDFNMQVIFKLIKSGNE